LRFDENGPPTQPVMLVTMAAVDSPRPSARNKLPALIFIIFPRFCFPISPNVFAWPITKVTPPLAHEARLEDWELPVGWFAGPFVMAGMFVAGQLVMAGTAFILAQLLIAGVTIGNV